MSTLDPAEQRDLAAVRVPIVPRLDAQLLAEAMSHRAGELPSISQVKPLLLSFHEALKASFFDGLPAAQVVHAR